MPEKPGIKTTELWLALIASVLSLLVGYGYITSEEKDLWTGVATAAIPLALAAISYGYSSSRASVKSASNK